MLRFWKDLSQIYQLPYSLWLYFDWNSKWDKLIDFWLADLTLRKSKLRHNYWTRERIAEAYGILEHAQNDISIPLPGGSGVGHHSANNYEAWCVKNMDMGLAGQFRRQSLTTPLETAREQVQQTKEAWLLFLLMLIGWQPKINDSIKKKKLQWVAASVGIYVALEDEIKRDIIVTYRGCHKSRK